MDTSADQYRQARQEKAQRLRELGEDPYGRPWQPDRSIAAARDLVPAWVDGAERQPRGARVRIAGRIGNLRKASGKLSFATLFDRSRAELWLA